VRLGFGYDVHRLVSGRKLVLGGVEVPFEKGLLGHSDADVLIHAISDAILGAIGEGDIGRHFPDNDIRFKDISSLAILEDVRKMANDRGFRISQVDSTIVAQRPRLAGFIPKMIENIAKTLSVIERDINVKAKTTEGLGFIGAEAGMAAYAVVLVEEV
jgi:2-C-methyl-D-erythritol 2,4-cyclodiphosphate synthase